MDGKKKYIFIAIAVIIIAVILYLVFKKKADKKKAETSANNTATTPASSTASKAAAAVKAVTTTPSASTSVFPLKMGSKGPEVAMLQRYILKEYNKDALPVYGADGQWGQEMEVAAMTYLKKNSVSSGWFKGAGINEY